VNFFHLFISFDFFVYIFLVSSDNDLLDKVTGTATITPDALISIAKIRSAAEFLRDTTAFVGDFQPLSTNIPLIKASVNELIAGPGHTLGDLFDLTGESRLFVMLPKILTKY
jgi:hypothetical protein